MNNEYCSIKSVLLFSPPPSIESDVKLHDILHNEKIYFRKIEKEFQLLIKCYQDLGIQTNVIPHEILDLNDSLSLFNMIYCRDLFLATPYGAMLSSMFHLIRRREVEYAQKYFIKSGIPILGRIQLPGTFEGADALWINSKNLAVGVGGRTNSKGFEQVKAFLAPYHIHVHSLPFQQKECQHLLGAVQIIDSKTVLIRRSIVGKEVLDFFKSFSYNIIPVEENEEIQRMQAMNIVTVAPRRILMSNDCPKTKKFYEKNRIQIAGLLSVSELRHGGGGLACVTGILERKRTE